MSSFRKHICTGTAGTIGRKQTILDVTRTRRKKQKGRQRYKFVQINESVCLFEGERSAAGDFSSFYLIVMNNIYKNMEIN